MEVLSSGVIALSFSLVRNALMISRSHPSRARPGAVSLSSQAWSISGWGIFALEHHDKCEHNRSCQWQKQNWIRFVEPHYWRIFATTLRYFCKNTSVFLQLHFAFLQHVPSTLRLNGTPLIQKTSRDKHAAPTDLWNEKVMIFCDQRGVTTDLLDV